MWCQILYLGKMVNIKEGEFSVLLVYLLELLKQHNSDSWLDNVSSKWNELMEGFGGGCGDFYFDELICSPDELKRMKDLFQELHDYLLNRKHDLPRDEVNRLNPPYVHLVRDQSINDLLGTIKKVLSVLDTNHLGHEFPDKT